MAEPDDALNVPLDLIEKARRFRDDGATAEDLWRRVLGAIGSAVGEHGGKTAAASLEEAAVLLAALWLRSAPETSPEEALGTMAKRHRTAAEAAGGIDGDVLPDIGAALKLLALPFGTPDQSLKEASALIEAALDRLVVALVRQA